MRAAARRRVFPIFAALLAGATSCAPPNTASRSEEGRFLVGEPYSLGGIWSYPREEFGLAEAGLAAVLPDARRGRRTANGEVHDPSALVAAHRTLQLPAVVRVWNLDTGREVRVRVNDRGPAQPGRIIGLSRRAAELLGVAPGEAARVRVVVDPDLSRAVAAGLPGAEGLRLVIAAAPVAAVEREQLAPPPGARAASATFGPAAARSATPADAPPAVRPPTRLPEEVAQRGKAFVRLVVDVGAFFRRDLAERRAAAVGGWVEPVGAGRQPEFRVRVGPFATAAEADRALDAALRRGIPDAKIVLD